MRFVCRDLPGAVGKLIVEHGHELRPLPAARPESPGLPAGWLDDARQTRDVLADESSWDWVIVDHYQLDARWESEVRSAAKALMVIDDTADRPHDCDLLLDQNEFADARKRYLGLIGPACRSLLGPQYALLRPEFGQARAVARVPRSRLGQLLIFFGGGDQINLTEIALRALRAAPLSDIAVDVVVGTMNPHRDRIEAECATLPNAVFHCQPTNFLELMLRADLALGAAGTTSWERCCVGLPAVLFVAADNQVEVARGIAGRRAAVNLGSPGADAADRLADVLGHLSRRPALLSGMSHRAASLVDGAGVQRVCVALLQDAAMALRCAREGDAEMAWEWRNAESTRRYSFDSNPIPLERHLAWWQAALQSQDRILLIGEIAGAAVGVLRFDLDGAVGTVSVYLDPRMTGQRLGPVLLRAGVEWARRNLHRTQRIEAFIKPDNVASRKAFLAAGFTDRQSCFVRTLSADRAH